MAEINLSSNELWDLWERWLRRLGITQIHEPTPGAMEMGRPPTVNLGVRRYWVFVVKLTGTPEALEALQARFGPDYILRKMWRPMPGPVSPRSSGDSSKEADEAVRRKKRKARARLGAEAAENDLFAPEE